MKKLVLTGAMGRLGTVLREPLSKLCDELVTSDILDGPSETFANETYVQADIADLGQTNPIHSTGWPNALPKISARFIGTRTGLNPFVCASSAVPRPPTPAPSGLIYPTTI